MILKCNGCGEIVERHNRISTVKCFKCKNKAKKWRDFNTRKITEWVPKKCLVCGVNIPKFNKYYCIPCGKDRQKQQSRESRLRHQAKKASV